MLRAVLIELQRNHGVPMINSIIQLPAFILPRRQPVTPDLLDTPHIIPRSFFGMVEIIRVGGVMRITMTIQTTLITRRDLE